LAALHAIAGLDVRLGLQRTMNKPTFYASMLGKFVTTQADALQRVRQHLAADNRAAAERTAHTLKAVSGTLGATGLQDSAGALENALAQGTSGPDLASLLDATQQQLAHLVQSLRQAPGLVPTPVALHSTPLSEAEQASAQEILQRITVYLAKDDATALALWEQHAALLRALQPQWQPIEAAIQAFEFDTALGLLS
jgi:two-component system sensor histidine kinase/response regulator